MSESSAPEGVIPYVDHHTGPKRLVSVSFSAAGPFSGATSAQVKPNLFVDGRQYIVYWGRVTVEVPADRAVHLGVGLRDGERGASLLLSAGSDPLELAYHAPVSGEPTFGPTA